MKKVFKIAENIKIVKYLIFNQSMMNNWHNVIKREIE